MADHSKMKLPPHEAQAASGGPRKLGRKAIKTDTRTLAFGDYLTPALPPPPAAADWTHGIDNWGMMLNDTLGDCTIAGRQHAIQVWSVNLGNEITLPDADALAAYEQWCGYNPDDSSTDQGGIELDVLTDWKQKGGSLDGHPLLAFADPKPARLIEIRQSIALFGGVYIGLSLPLTAQKQDVWDVVPNGGDDAEPGSWGGHAVFVPKYDANGFTCITWGQPKIITLAFWKKYCDEAHTLLSPDWIAAQGAPSGFDLSQLQADLKAIR
jgi:hypothetical protein